MHVTAGRDARANYSDFINGSTTHSVYRSLVVVVVVVVVVARFESLASH